MILILACACLAAVPERQTEAEKNRRFVRGVQFCFHQKLWEGKDPLAYHSFSRVLITEDDILRTQLQGPRECQAMLLLSGGRGGETHEKEIISIIFSPAQLRGTGISVVKTIPWLQCVAASCSRAKLWEELFFFFLILLPPTTPLPREEVGWGWGCQQSFYSFRRKKPTRTPAKRSLWNE